MSSQAAAVYKVVYIEPRNAVIFFPRKASGADLSAYLQDVLHAKFFWFADAKSPDSVAPLTDLASEGAWSWPGVILVGTPDNSASDARRIANKVASAPPTKPAHVISLAERERALEFFKSWSRAQPTLADKLDGDDSSRSLVSNIGSVVQQRKVQFGRENDVREFSKRASAQAVSQPTKYMLRVQRADALRSLAATWVPQNDASESMPAADGAKPVLFRVRNAAQPKRDYVQFNCRNLDQFQFVQQIASRLPEIAVADPAARAVVFDTSDLAAVSPVLTTATLHLLDQDGMWPGEFALTDLAFSQRKRMLVLLPQWLLSHSRSKSKAMLFWYDAIQGLSGDEYVHIQESYLPLTQRSIAKIANLEKVIQGVAQKQVLQLAAIARIEYPVEEDIDDMYF